MMTSNNRGTKRYWVGDHHDDRRHYHLKLLCYRSCHAEGAERLLHHGGKKHLVLLDKMRDKHLMVCPAIFIELVGRPCEDGGLPWPITMGNDLRSDQVAEALTCRNSRHKQGAKINHGDDSEDIAQNHHHAIALNDARGQQQNGDSWQRIGKGNQAKGEDQ